MLISSVSLLSGCATIVNGRTQTVMVDTTPVQGAACTLKNNKGNWVLNSTPGSVAVHRSAEALFISCTKPGYKQSMQSFKSTTKAMLAGNLLFGGIIGGAVDAGDGAAFDYPSQMMVPLQK